MTRKWTGTVYTSSAAVEITPPLPRHMRPSAKLPSELISAANAIVVAPMKKLLPNWSQKSLRYQYPFEEHPGEGLERRVRRPEVAGEFGIAFGVEGDQQHVVERE